MGEGEDAYVGKKRKGDNVQDEENQIGGPVQEAAGKWKQEEERKEDAEGSDNLSVDEPLLIPG